MQDMSVSFHNLIELTMFENVTILYNHVLLHSHSCSIEVPSGDKVIITGGFLAYTSERVQMYTALGATERLPDLQQPRYNHGCGSFVNNNKETVSTTKYIK